jgi:hypothetical protein
MYASMQLRPIVIFGHCHEEALIRLKARLLKNGVANFVAGRLGGGEVGEGEDVACAALVIVSTTTTSSEERDRIGREARRCSVPVLLLS